MRWLVLGFVAAGCNGDGGGGGNDTDLGTCDDLVTAPLPTVPSTDWPEGLAEAITSYQEFGGRYEVSNTCGDGIAVKITPPLFETLEVVTEPYNTTQECGCTVDPDFPDDAQLDMLATMSGFEVFIESWTDPGIAGQTVVGSGALYAEGTGMLLRACGTEDIDPYLQSAYDQLDVVIRIDESGSLVGLLRLTPVDPEAPVEICDLSNFNLQE